MHQTQPTTNGYLEFLKWLGIVILNYISKMTMETMLQLVTLLGTCLYVGNQYIILRKNLRKPKTLKNEESKPES